MPAPGASLSAHRAAKCGGMQNGQQSNKHSHGGVGDFAQSLDVGLRKCSATNRRWILPVAVLGRASAMKSLLGTLKSPRTCLAAARISDSGVFAPGLKTTAAFTSSPYFSSGAANATASATVWHPSRAESTSKG